MNCKLPTTEYGRHTQLFVDELIDRKILLDRIIDFFRSGIDYLRSVSSAGVSWNLCRLPFLACSVISSASYCNRTRTVWLSGPSCWFVRSAIEPNVRLWLAAILVL